MSGTSALIKLEVKLAKFTHEIIFNKLVIGFPNIPSWHNYLLSNLKIRRKVLLSMN